MSHLVSLCLISPTLSRRSSNSVSLCAVGSCEVALPHGQGQVPAFPGGLTWKATAQGDSLVKLGVSLSLRFCTWPPPDLLQHRPRALANTQKSALPKSLPWLPIAFRTTVSAGEFAGSAEETHCKNDTPPPHRPLRHCVCHGGLPGGRPCAGDKQRQAWSLCLEAYTFFTRQVNRYPTIMCILMFKSWKCS
uniref:Uncharacterized protein n=1 Tax=Myotis myotis TaxID=51298 RepID=A0A7J7XH80_MYOMY|nr:hypothetical protein mMyoMyo1_011640 [Myotis myotis]